MIIIIMRPRQAPCQESYTRTDIRKYICMYVCMCIYIYVHIERDIDIHIQKLPYNTRQSPRRCSRGSCAWHRAARRPRVFSRVIEDLRPMFKLRISKFGVYTHICIYIYIYTHTYMYICMYVCMYIYIYTYIHMCSTCYYIICTYSILKVAKWGWINGVPAKCPNIAHESNSEFLQLWWYNELIYATLRFTITILHYTILYYTILY